MPPSLRGVPDEAIKERKRLRAGKPARVMITRPMCFFFSLWEKHLDESPGKQR